MTLSRLAITLALVAIVAATLLPIGAPRAEPAVAAATEPRLPMRLALQTEGAFGVATGSFRNQLAGARLDLQFSPRVSFGGYVGYANLKGKDGRVSDVLLYAQAEYMLPLTASARVRVPLRFASGYLPRNGPVVRMATGLAVALGPRVDLVTELFAPMFWVTNDQMLLSMNLSLEVALRL